MCNQSSLHDAMITRYNKLWQIIIRTNCLKAYPTNNLEQSANYSKPSLHIRNVVESKPFVVATFNYFNPQNHLLWSFHIIYPFILWGKVHLLALQYTLVNLYSLIWGTPTIFYSFFLLNKVINICLQYLMEKIISPLNGMSMCKKDLDKKVKLC